MLSVCIGILDEFIGNIIAMLAKLFLSTMPNTCFSYQKNKAGLCVVLADLTYVLLQRCEYDQKTHPKDAEKC